MINLKHAALMLLPIAIWGCASSKIAIRALPAFTNAPLADDQALAKGRMLFDRGEFALAADAFRKAVRYNASSSDAYNGLAASYDQLGRYDLSRRYYELALAQAPEDGKILRNFARSMLRQGDALSARKLVAEAAALETGKDNVLANGVDKKMASADRQALSGQGSITIPLDDTAIHDPAIRLEQAEAPSLLRTISSVAVSLLPKPTNVASITLDPPSAYVPLDKRTVVQVLPRLHVMNAVGRKYQAARMRSYLSHDGWNAVSTGDSRKRLLRSRILFAGNNEDAARKLAASLPFRPKMQLSRTAPTLFLMLGQDAVAFDKRLRLPIQG
jgi:tetratricopeptide (TPR) repeat protein